MYKRQGAVEDDGGTDAQAQPEQDEGVAVAGGTVALFRQGGEVGLVLDADPGLGELLLECGRQPAVPLGQPGGVPQFTAGRVDQTGGTDPDGVQPVGAGLLHRALDQAHRLFHRGAGAGVVVDGHGRLGEDPAEQVGDEHGDALGAYVEGGEVGAAGDDAVQLGVGSAALLAGFPRHLDQSGGGEAFDEVGDGGPGQAGQLLQLACRQRALLLEQMEGEPVVDGPGGARGCGHAGILPDRRRGGPRR